MPATPGVYRMLDRKGDALYVGKARNLKSRVQNYTHPAGLSNRLRRMVAETAAMEIVVTAHRGRGAAARMQPDQAPDAALQRAAARRQVVSVHPSDRRSRFPAADQVPRRARQGGQRISARSPRPARSTAPWSRCRRRFCCARAATASSPTAPAPACCTRSSAAARLASAASTATITRALIEQAHAVPVRPQRRHPAAPRGRDGQRPPRRSISRRRR